MRGPRVVVAAAIVFALGMLSGGTIGGTFGAFSHASSNGTNSFSASSCTSSTQTLNPDRDALVSQPSPTSNFGTLTFLRVRSQTSSQNSRGFVHFAMPSVPSGCTLSSAFLRLYSTASAAGRTLQVFQAAASWTETGITWNNQPASAGSAATAGSALGWVQWTVTSQVQSMYGGSNEGFLVRDSVENAASAQTNDFNSREAASNQPQLLLSFAWQACGSAGNQTVLSSADSLVAQATPTTNYGTDAVNYGTRSLNGGNARSLVTFSLPSLGTNCQVAGATLRLWTSAGATGRTLQAIRAASSWTETGVTWNNQPSTTGTTVTAASVASGWVEWTVTSHAQTMYSGSNFGWLLRDASENAGSSVNQGMHPRENTNDPQLVITVG